MLFAKNSDRLPNECQHLRLYPAQNAQAGEEVRCQYLSVHQARHTYRVLGGQPFWLWGFEQGVNECGVAIGNEAIWTKAERQATGLLGMDLVRLGLERGSTAREALEVITALLAEYGQGGSPRHNDPAAVGYDNSFILADPQEAWVLETSGRDWVARRVEGVASISNVPSIDAQFDAASPALRDRPGLDFARDLGDYDRYPQTNGQARCGRSRMLLQARSGQLTPADMMAFLRDHGADMGWRPAPDGAPTICMHPGTGQTAASMVVEYRPEGLIAWCSMVTPCVSVFLPFFITAEVPASLAVGAAAFDVTSAWWRIRRLGECAAADWERRFPMLRAAWGAWERELMAEAPRHLTAAPEEQSVWVERNASDLAARIERLERELGLVS